MRSFSGYDFDRALDLVQGLRDGLKGEDRRLADLVADLVQAAADSAYEYALEETGEDEARGAPASAATPAQAGAAA